MTQQEFTGCRRLGNGLLTQLIDFRGKSRWLARLLPNPQLQVICCLNLAVFKYVRSGGVF